MSAIPQHLAEKQTKLIVGPEFPYQTKTYTDHSAFSALGVESPLTEEDLQNMMIKVLSQNDEELVFDIVGVDLSIVNALRRILIAEIPTVAIEAVDFYNNTSVIPDEVLAHRLGLIPLAIDPSLLEYKSASEPFTARNSVQFNLHVECTKKYASSGTSVSQGADALASAVNDLAEKNKYVNSSVYSRQLEWVPLNDGQKGKFQAKPPRPVHDDILIAKLRPGQQIDVRMHCVKGIGKDHAKFSPVCTASYRLLPAITLKHPVTGPYATALRDACPLHVFDVEEATAALYVSKPRNCSCCRECLRGAWVEKAEEGKESKEETEETKQQREMMKDAVELARVKNYFSVESTGIVPAPVLMVQAFDVFISKLDAVTAALESKAATGPSPASSQASSGAGAGAERAEGSLAGN